MKVGFVLVLISVFVLHDMERAVVKLIKTCGQTHLPECCYGYKVCLNYTMYKLSCSCVAAVKGKKSTNGK